MWRYSNDAELRQAYHRALDSGHHSLLTADRPRDDRLDFARSVARGLAADPPTLGDGLRAVGAFDVAS